MAAERAGADRIELCAELTLGGTTPSVAMMKAVRASVRIPVYVMIRPRAGGFFYSEEEFAGMREDIRQAQQCGMNGVVLGILDADGHVDITRTRELVQFAQPLRVTFHRAFDESSDLSAALEAVVETGACRILTSGGRPRAVDGLVVLASLVRQAGNRIAIMPGAGTNAANVEELLRQTSAREIHASLGLTSLATSRYDDANALAMWEQDVRKLKAAI